MTKTAELLDLTVRELIESGGSVKTPERVQSDKTYVRRLRELEANKEHFTRVSDREAVRVFQSLTLTQAGVLLGCLAYVGLNAGGFIMSGDKKLTLAELAKELNHSARTVRNSMMELVALGYIEESKEGKRVFYKVNQKLASRGSGTSKGYFSKLYLVKLRSALRVMTNQEAGLLFFMLPFFNSRFHVVGPTPYELDAGKVELWNREQLAEAIGLSVPQTQRLVYSLMKKGVLIGIKTMRTAIVLSPRLVSRQIRKVTIEDIQTIIENELNYKKDW